MWRQPCAAEVALRVLKWLGGVLLALAGLVLFTPLGDLAAVAVMNMRTTTEFRVDGSDLLMRGEINARTLDQFEAIMAENPQITRLVELVVPGSVDDDTMIRLAYRVRQMGLDTHLRADSQIYSGGVDLFLAGVRRSAEPGARIGVHAWSDGFKEASDYPREAPEHEQNRKFVEDMLGVDDFYWFTINAAPAGEMHVMSAEEIERYGLLTGP